MNDKGGGAAPDLKKWLFFLVFLAILVPIYFLLVNPGNEDEARQQINDAESRFRQAQSIAQKNRTPQNLTSIEMAEESLEKAKSYLVESDYEKAIEQARSVVLYSEKILERQSPAGELRGPIRLEDLVGEITIRKQFNAAFAAADLSTPVGQGDTIKTLDGSCRIIFSGKMETIIRPSSELQIPDLQMGDEEGVSELVLESGEVRIRVMEPNRKPILITGTGKVSVYPNSEAWIHFIPSSGSLDVRVVQGRAEIRSNTDAAINVLRNQQAIVTSAGPWKEAVDLPIPPELASPSNFNRFNANSNGFALVNLSWSPSPSGEYYLEVSSDNMFRGIVQDRRTRRDSIEFSDLRQGTYYWRVSSIGQKDTRGLPSAPRQFEIVGTRVAQEGQVLDTKPPALSVKRVTIQGYIVILEGTAEPSAKVTIDGLPAIMDEHTGEWMGTLQEPTKGIYPIIIIATDRAGNRTTIEKRVEIRD